MHLPLQTVCYQIKIVVGSGFVHVLAFSAFVQPRKIFYLSLKTQKCSTDSPAGAKDPKCAHV